MRSYATILSSTYKFTRSPLQIYLFGVEGFCGENDNTEFGYQVVISQEKQFR